MLGYEDVIFKNTLFSADSAEGNNNANDIQVAQDAEMTHEQITDERLDKIEEQLGIGEEDTPRTEAKIEWSPENLGEAAGYMGVGMLGVFLIVGIIMGATYAINAIINKIANRKKDAE